jgi:hypothetical protein
MAMSDINLPEPHFSEYAKLTQAQKDAAHAFEKAASAALGTTEQSRATMLSWSLLTAFVCATLFVLIIMYMDRDRDRNPMILFVILTGILGALLSSLIELYANKNPSSFVGVQGTGGMAYLNAVAYALVPPVVGAVSACAVYGMFASNILGGGAFFPEFGCQKPDGVCKGFQSFLTAWEPNNAVDGARLLVWCLVAGFAERLVPDKLKGLVGAFGSENKPE